MIDHQRDRRVAIVPAVGAQEAHREIDPDHAAGLADRRQLLVGEIARVRAQGVGVGVRRNERRVAQLGHVPEAAFVDVRQVDQDLQPVAGADQLLAKVGQARARVRRRRAAERHAVPERVRPAPYRTERAQARGMQHVKRFELRIDRLRAFDMQNRRQHAGFDAPPDFVDGTADADLAARLAFDADQDRRHARDDRLRLREFERRRQRRAHGGVERECVACAAPSAVWRRHEDREQPAGEAALPGHRQVELPFGLAFEEGARRVRAAAREQPQQHVIVPIEDRNGPWRCHRRSSVAASLAMRPLPADGVDMLFESTAIICAIELNG